MPELLRLLSLRKMESIMLIYSQHTYKDIISSYTFLNKQTSGYVESALKKDLSIFHESRHVLDWRPTAPRCMVLFGFDARARRLIFVECNFFWSSNDTEKRRSPPANASQTACRSFSFLACARAIPMFQKAKKKCTTFSLCICPAVQCRYVLWYCSATHKYMRCAALRRAPGKKASVWPSSLRDEGGDTAPPALVVRCHATLFPRNAARAVERSKARVLFAPRGTTTVAK